MDKIGRLENELQNFKTKTIIIYDYEDLYSNKHQENELIHKLNSNNMFESNKYHLEQDFIYES